MVETKSLQVANPAKNDRLYTHLEGIPIGLYNYQPAFIDKPILGMEGSGAESLVMVI